MTPIIEDIHGNAIDPTSSWYWIRQEFREYLAASEEVAAEILSGWDGNMKPPGLGEKMNRKTPFLTTKLARENMSAAARRAHAMSAKQRKERNSKIVREYHEGKRPKVLAHEHNLDHSWIMQIIGRAPA